MARAVLMPKLGLTMTEAHLASWLVAVGDRVQAEDPLFDVETDKITSCAPTPYGGVLLACVAAGQDIPVGQPVAVIGEPGEDVSAIPLYAPPPEGVTRT